MSKTGGEVAGRAQSDLPAVPEYGDHMNEGFEGQTQEDIVLPFLSLLQGLSPQCKSPDEGGLDGAKPGMLLNSVTGDVFSGREGVTFVPACTQHVFVEWVPRDQGGGFVAVHDITSEIVKQAKKLSQDFGRYSTEYNADGKPTGNDLVETFYVYGVLAHDDQLEPVVVGFTSTKIAVYKRWNTKLNLFTIPSADGRKQRPPLFAHLVKITSQRQVRKANEFHNFVLSPANGDIRSSLLDPKDPRFTAALEVREMIKSGAARASYETQEPSGGGGGEGGSSGPDPF